jgi:hypothetical protein
MAAVVQSADLNNEIACEALRSLIRSKFVLFGVQY